MLLQIINILVALGAFTGIMLLAHKQKLGFIVFFMVELCMFYIGYMSAQYGVLAMSIIYFFSNIYAYWQWTKDEKPKPKHVCNFVPVATHQGIEIHGVCTECHNTNLIKSFRY